MRDIKEMLLAWDTVEDMSDEEVAYCEEYLENVSFEEDHDYKCITFHTIYKDKSTGKHYAAWVQRVDDGHWGNNEKVDEGVYEVEPQIITKTIYVAIK